MKYCKSWALIGCAVVLIGCSANEEVTDVAPSAIENGDGEKSLSQVRLHFSNFMKSKSGAT